MLTPFLAISTSKQPCKKVNTLEYENTDISINTLELMASTETGLSNINSLLENSLVQENIAKKLSRNELNRLSLSLLNIFLQIPVLVNKIASTVSLFDLYSILLTTSTSDHVTKKMMKLLACPAIFEKIKAQATPSILESLMQFPEGVLLTEQLLQCQSIADILTDHKTYTIKIIKQAAASNNLNILDVLLKYPKNVDRIIEKDYALLKFVAINCKPAVVHRFFAAMKQNLLTKAISDHLLLFYGHYQSYLKSVGDLMHKMVTFTDAMSKSGLPLDLVESMAKQSGILPSYFSENRKSKAATKAREIVGKHQDALKSKGLILRL